MILLLTYDLLASPLSSLPNLIHFFIFDYNFLVFDFFEFLYSKLIHCLFYDKNFRQKNLIMKYYSRH